MLGGCSGGARGGAHRLAGGMSGGCPGLLEGWPGGGRPAARPALRSAPRAAAGGAAGPEGGSGAGRGWRLQPGSPAGQAPLTRLLCKWSSPVPPASLTSSPPAGRKGKEGGMGWGGSPGPPAPGGRVLAQGWQCHQAWHPPAGDPAATPWQVGTQEGQGWARLGGLCWPHPSPSDTPQPCPCTPGCSSWAARVGARRGEMEVGDRGSPGGSR